MTEAQRPGSYSSGDPPTLERLAQELPEDEGTTPPSAEKPKDAPSKEAKPKTWEENLKDAKITPEQAWAILDAILSTGYYERTFELFQGRYPVVLRTRNSASRVEIARYLDLIPAIGERTAYERRSQAVLLYSLVSLGSTKLPWPPEDAQAADRDKVMAEREMIINRIPAALLEPIYAAVSHFENATFAALSGGAPTGF